MGILEGKIQLLDDQIDALKNKLDTLADKHSRRDEIVIELFRMLKDNLDSRMQLLLQFNGKYSGKKDLSKSSQLSNYRKLKQKNR